MPRGKPHTQHGGYVRADAPPRPEIRPLAVMVREGATLKQLRMHPDVRWPNKHHGQAFRLMDLPPEVRKKIYAYWLVVEDGIELCPEPFAFRPNQNSNIIVRDDGERRPDGVKHERAEVLHLKHRSEIIGEGVLILRLSKKLHYESAAILYGANEFRFSNLAGWLGFGAFLLIIGKPNAQRMRHITIVHPCVVSAPSSPRNCETMMDGFSCLFPHLHWSNDWRSFMKDLYRWDDEGWRKSRLLHWLHQMRDLRHLRLLIHREHEHPDRPISAAVREERFKALDITIASIGRSDMEPWLEKPLPFTASQLVEKHNKENGTRWKAEKLWLGYLGFYTTQNLHQRRMLE